MRHNHMQNKSVPFTVTTCFKGPPRELIAKAWRILRAVTDGKELFPRHVQQYQERCLARWCGGTAPGSASDPSAASGTTQHIEESMVPSADESAARAPEMSGQAALDVDSQPADRGD